jgi:transposase
MPVAFLLTVAPQRCRFGVYFQIHQNNIRLAEVMAFVLFTATCAPDLNPVEMSWNHTKHADLAIFVPADVHNLTQVMYSSIGNTRKNSHLVRSFFTYAALDL